jgi:hypothetical protein
LEQPESWKDWKVGTTGKLERLESWSGKEATMVGNPDNRKTGRIGLISLRQYIDGTKHPALMAMRMKQFRTRGFFLVQSAHPLFTHR